MEYPAILNVNFDAKNEIIQDLFFEQKVLFCHTVQRNTS